MIESRGPVYQIPLWNCTAWAGPPPPPATNVTQLHIQDIKVIMAVGDSIGAGFAMHSGPADEPWALRLIEYRGDTFHMGGNEGQYSLANFLKVYNPDLIGASVGETLPLDAIKWKEGVIEPFVPHITHLNAAQSQAKIENVAKQVDYLIEQLNTTYAKTVNMTHDWKMLNLLIGANNLCGACFNRSYADPDYYEQTLDAIVGQIYQNIPRTVVNLIALFNISQVHTFAMTSEYCRVMWKDIVKTECMCLQGDATDADRLAMDVRTVEFNRRINLVASRWQAKQLLEFNVKVQPFAQNMRIPSLSYLSELDCFHPHAYADAAFAIGLWNNIQTPDAEKESDLNPATIGFQCPTKDTILY
ncbi:hypothetical protein CAOG_000259 [Capsaspora owczarzaki ATCC 30864]|uniref:Uncharacterized protein n=2 Tax=Capsaspora owczarzaki (strain ATCC 30864) TaxID=595528 RepID=A0A0D2WGS6_CAPO3|nr:hypothetical protein CAOG_000259 [Capsaspora owczarzaki ATCC 30864]